MQFEVRAHELETLLDRAPAGVEILSLDCFDTIIWRNTHAPMDVFADLGLPGGGVERRGWAEAKARRRAFATSGAKEIRLAEVYRSLYPSIGDAELADAVARELEIEAGHAVAFAPAVALIREAKRRGLKVIVVSDIYMSEAELRAHIAGAAGQEVLALVDRVFASAEYGVGKRDGLFAHVIKAIGVPAHRIIHVGDNRAADYVAAGEAGLHSAHLRQFDDETERRLRMEAAAAVMIDPAVRTNRPACQPHRAQVALRRDENAAYVLGHDVLGPVLHTFALWLKADLDAQSERLGRPVRPLFVMRDGWLPFQAFDALFPEAGAATVELSRFVAIRASIRDAASLDDYLAEWLHRLPLRSLARQLMLYDREVAAIARIADPEKRARAFADAVRAPGLRRKVIERCRGFADKLFAHLRAAGVEPGDAVALVDIGYNGTVQNILTPVLAERMGLAVAGRYLFLREEQLTGLDKRGMLDVERYDCRTLHALSTCVVAIEQLCNIEQGSTIDFDKDGTPIREGVDAKAAHNGTRDAVQRACLRYLAEAGSGVVRPARSDDLDARVRAAAAILARLFFLPNAREVQLFAGLGYDMNMGSGLAERMIDIDRGATGVRRRGLTFYNDRDLGFLSAELHAQGLPATLAMFAATRFGLDLRSTDFEVGGIEVPVIVATATEQAVIPYTAWPTADGYYRLAVPVGAARPSLGIQLGQLCEWVQVEELSFTPLADLEPGAKRRRIESARGMPDAMEQVSGNLWRAEPTGLLFVPPPLGDEPVLLTLVFRPVRKREPAAELRIAA